MTAPNVDPAVEGTVNAIKYSIVSAAMEFEDDVEDTARFDSQESDYWITIDLVRSGRDTYRRSNTQQRGVRIPKLELMLAVPNPVPTAPRIGWAVDAFTVFRRLLEPDSAVVDRLAAHLLDHLGDLLNEVRQAEEALIELLGGPVARRRIDLLVAQFDSVHALQGEPDRRAKARILGGSTVAIATALLALFGVVYTGHATAEAEFEKARLEQRTKLTEIAATYAAAGGDPDKLAAATAALLRTADAVEAADDD